MLWKGLVLVVVLYLPLASNAQTTYKKHVIKTKIIPTWADVQHYNGEDQVYFPDYYTFYDPNRGGYVFWNKGQWTFTPAMPPYMANVDMGKTRVQLLKNLSLDLRPETSYPRYMKLYPPAPGGISGDVPVPTLPIAGGQ